MMSHKSSHGKQMAQHLHPYYPIPTIHNLPIEQFHQTNLNPEEWENYMEKEIKKAEHKSSFQKHKVIGFVPRALFEVKPQSYCPRILTIGPLYQNLEPSHMDRCKALCVKKFMERHGISDLRRLMNELIPEPRKLGDIYFGFSPAYNFESMRLLVTVDTIFIHEFLLFLSQDCPHTDERQSWYMYTFINNAITLYQIWRDLLLIGNQIPMSFLKRIINIPFKESPHIIEINLLKCLEYFVSINDPFVISRLHETQRKQGDENLPHHRCEDNETEPKQGGQNLLKCEHLLDCLYVSCTHGSPQHSPELQNSKEPQKSSVPQTSREVQKSPDPEESMNGSRRLQLMDILLRGWQKSKMYTACLPKTTEDSKTGTSSKLGWKKRNNHGGRLQPASELIKAGIRFKAREGNTSVIKYSKSKSRLYLPRLVVFDGTEDILRNLIAHEQTSKDGGEVCGYAMIMDSLIDTQEDIAILTRARVLENHLGSDERLVQMWNDMCINISERSNPEKFVKMINDIMEHYRIHWRVLYVEFRAKFCSRPWLWISAFAAMILLILSLLQTIYTMLGFY